MAYDDHFRLSAHAVITDDEGKILLLKATYGDKLWSLPGGSFDPGETVHETLLRECQEELGVAVTALYLSGIYYHRPYNSHAFIFRCTMPKDSQITLSEEHSEWAYFSLTELRPVQQHRVRECLEFSGEIKSAKF